MCDSHARAPIQRYGAPAAVLAICATTLLATLAIATLAGLTMAFGTPGFIVGLGTSGLLLATLAGMALTALP